MVKNEASTAKIARLASEIEGEESVYRAVEIAREMSREAWALHSATMQCKGAYAERERCRAVALHVLNSEEVLPDEAAQKILSGIEDEWTPPAPPNLDLKTGIRAPDSGRGGQPLPSLPPYDLAAEMLLHAADLFAGREEGDISEYLEDIQGHPVLLAMRGASETGHELIRRQTATVRSRP